MYFFLFTDLLRAVTRIGALLIVTEWEKGLSQIL